MNVRRRSLLSSAGAALVLKSPARAADAAGEISFYFPISVGGPITKIIDGYAADFQRENPRIKVTPIYAGSYQDTLTRAQTALRAIRNVSRATKSIAIVRVDGATCRSSVAATPSAVATITVSSAGRFPEHTTITTATSSP